MSSTGQSSGSSQDASFLHRPGLHPAYSYFTWSSESDEGIVHDGQNHDAQSTSRYSSRPLFAQELPSNAEMEALGAASDNAEQRRDSSDASVAGDSKVQGNAFVRRYGLDHNVSDVLQSVDLSLFSAMMEEPPRFTAVYMSCGDLHTLLKSEGNVHPTAFTPQLVAALTEAASDAALPGQQTALSRLQGQQFQGFFICPDLRVFASMHGIPSESLPTDINFAVAAPVYAAGGRGQGPLVIGSAIVFHDSNQIQRQAQSIVKSLAHSTSALLGRNFDTMRRMKEQHQQEQIVHLMRMTQGEFGYLPSSNNASDRERVVASGHADLEQTFFQQAADAARDVLDADAVVVFDISGFKFDTAAYITHSRKEEAGQSRNTTDGARGEISASSTTSPAPNNEAEDIEFRRPASRSRQMDYTVEEHRSEPRSVSSEVVSKDQQQVCIVCSYTSTRTPIPLLALSGRASLHWRDLDGHIARPAFAKFLADTKASGNYGRSHAEGQLTSPDVDVLGSGSLAQILPSKWQSLLAAPVFETNSQPCYLLVAGFKSKPALFEQSDRLFLETVGGILLSSALRIRSQAIDRAQVQLTSRMQHQLRTPLHTIIGICESAGDLISETADNRRIVASIGLSAEALDSTISDVFDYSVLAGIKEPRIASSDLWPSVNFRDLFSVVTRTALSAWRLHCLSLTWLQEDATQVPPPPELVCTTGPSSWEDLPERFTFDCEALTRITSKVVVNALQATEKGVVSVNLGIKPADASTRLGRVSDLHDLHLTVSDTGKGMSEDFLRNHVFRPFTLQGDESTDAGLSLSICSSLMLRLGGRIHIASQVGKGSSLDFAFPCRGTGAPAVKSSGLKAAMVPVADNERARGSFEAFCKKLLSQYGAEYIGDGRKDPTLLADAAIILIAGEGTSKDDKRCETVELIKKACGNNIKQILLDLPNRAYFDPPSGLKPQRKQCWMDDLPTIQVYRPLVLSDLEMLEGIFDDVVRGEPVYSQAFLSTASFKQPRSKVGDPLASQPRQNQFASDQMNVQQPSDRTDEQPLVADLKRDNQANTRPAHPQPGPGKRDRRPFTCLVVEDNPLNARILVTLLKRASIDLFEAQDGVEAVEMFKKHLPQVVLLDINMPRMNGFDAAKEMRKVQVPFKGYHARILAVTALSAETDKLRGFDSGIDDWLTKPVRLAQLARDVKAWKQEVESQQEADNILDRREASGQNVEAENKDSAS
ncbi:unnamed protein product [Jaminaea pallidilutea]